MKDLSSKALRWLIVAVGVLLFMVLVVLKLIVKLGGGRGSPCPASLAVLVDNPLRRRGVTHILDQIGLQAGETVLELGPGPGAFTVEAAQRLGPAGRLIAVDIQPAMIARVDAKVQAAGLHNVETHVADAYELPLNNVSVDRVYMITVLPEIPDQVRALREAHRVLKPDGVLSISEQFLDPHYPRRVTTLQWAEKAGFESIASSGGIWQYTLSFRKIQP